MLLGKAIEKVGGGGIEKRIQQKTQSIYCEN
jgi:hypothetical protein